MRKFYLIGFLFLLLFDTLGQCSFKLTAQHSGMGAVVKRV